MLKLLTILLVLPCSFLVAQSNKIEIYLVKSNFPTQQGIQGYFMPRIEDLEPVPFIADAEIKGYRVIKDTFRMPVKRLELTDGTVRPAASDSAWMAAFLHKDTATVSVVHSTHIIDINSSAWLKQKALHPSLSAGIRFALVVNHKVIYGGYFWNLVSSFGCHWVFAFELGNEIRIFREIPDYGIETKENDPRQNDLLFTCLRKTNRLKN